MDAFMTKIEKFSIFALIHIVPKSSLLYEIGPTLTI
jgi:hypothetical protein